MTQLLPEAVDTSTVGQRVRRRWLSWRWWLVVAGTVVTVAFVLALLVPVATAGDLDPESAAPGGTRALAQVLQRQGVSVARIRTSAELATQDGPGSTLVVTHPELLGPRQLDRLASTSADLVLVEPDAPLLAALAKFSRVAGTVPARYAAPECQDPAAVAAGVTRAGGHLYRALEATTAACYPQPEEPGVTGLLRGRAAGRAVTVLGQGDVLRNGHLAEQGDAALALRLLGAHPRLTWYLPDALELSDGQRPPTTSQLLPRWVPWVVAQLGVTALVAILWRMRRLGRLVTEPLPVVVRAAETQEGRARLYRQAGARARAAAILRTATARRLVARLDVPPDVDAGAVADLAAQAIGQPPESVRATLLGPPPPDDAALVRLADRLDALEQAVAQVRVTAGGPVRPAAPHPDPPPKGPADPSTD